MKIASQSLINMLTSPRLVMWLVPWLMVLLVLGTISQRYIGLYASEKLFFSAWWLWVGPIPLPATYPTLGLLALGLAAKLGFKTRWRKAQAGTILTHIGALLLLIGGLITAITKEEGYITLAEGQQLASISDYHQRELVIFKNDTKIHTLSHSKLQKGRVIQNAEMPFALTIHTACRHCVAEFRAASDVEAAPNAQAYRGLAEKIDLEKAPLQKEDEENLSGIEFLVSDSTEAQDGFYMVYEPTPHQPEITLGKDTYRIAIQKAQRALPFTVRLESFQKYIHPGTDMASEYQSDVSIIEQSGLAWQQSIRMNEPLRTHGYTLYQSSFIDARGEIRSVLAVVKDHGFLFPYIASILMALGLMLQVAIRAQKGKI